MCILVFPKTIHRFQEHGSILEDTMKLMSGWRAGFIHPSETILTLDEGHVALIGSRILSTSFLALTNNLVLSFSKLGGT